MFVEYLFYWVSCQLDATSVDGVKVEGFKLISAHIHCGLLVVFDIMHKVTSRQSYDVHARSCSHMHDLKTHIDETLVFKHQHSRHRRPFHSINE